MPFSIAIITAVIIDLLIGDPRFYPHPVRIIGSFINYYEKTFRKLCPEKLYWAGFLTVSAVLLSVFIILTLLFSICSLLPYWVNTIVTIFILYTSVAIKDLRDESMAVAYALRRHDLCQSRTLLARIVGRDTAELTDEAIARAAVETVAENAADGIIAPLFWAVVASLASTFLPYPPLLLACFGAYIYKAINTMDSMLGYKNERYLHFGRAAARLDDLANYLPARLTAWAIIAVAYYGAGNGPEALATYRRDHDKHSSPNAAHPESALAGALRIQLGGPSYYFGKKVSKPYIGKKIVSINPETIRLANQLITKATFFSIITLLFIRFILNG